MTITDLIVAQADRTPRATAVVCGPARIDYATLDLESTRLAHRLRDRGVGVEVPVGVCLERSEAVVVVFLAVLKAGGVYVPIDPDYPDQRISLMIETAAVGIVVTDSVLAGTLPVDPDLCLLVDEAADACSTPLDVRVDDDNLCAMVFTSGSTGTPKCAMLTHANLVGYSRYWTTTLLSSAPMRVHLQMAGMAFVVFLGDLSRALPSGATLVISPRETTLAPEELYDLMVREAVTSAEFVPPVLKLLIDSCEERGARLDFLDLLVAGGDIWHSTDYARARLLCGDNTRLVSAYGMTETSIDSTTVVDLSPDESDPIVPIGHPVTHTRCYVLDEQLSPVPDGTGGELYIAGTGVCRGYLNSPALTAERFVADPFSPTPGERMYRTGDRAVVGRDGALRILGRVDNQVKIDGIRVETGEVEAVLRTHPDVSDAAVVGDGPPGSRSLTAFVVVRTGGSTTGDRIRTYLRTRLPAAAVPSLVVIVPSIALNQHGKVDRQRLRDRSS